MLADKWINCNAKPETILHQTETSSKISSSITENIVGFMKPSQSKSSNNITKAHYDGSGSTTKSRTSEDSRTELNPGIFQNLLLLINLLLKKYNNLKLIF